MPYITTEAEVWVDLGDFDDDELLKELESRKMNYSGGTSGLIQRMYEQQQLGQDIQPLLNELYYATIGRIA